MLLLYIAKNSAQRSFIACDGLNLMRGPPMQSD